MDELDKKLGPKIKDIISKGGPTTTTMNMVLDGLKSEFDEKMIRDNKKTIRALIEKCTLSMQNESGDKKKDDDEDKEEGKSKKKRKNDDEDKSKEKKKKKKDE